MNTSDKAWAQYSERFRREVMPKIMNSAIFLSIGAAPGHLDVQQATELGAALILGKPLLLVLPPGRTLSASLRRAADVVLEDWDPDSADAQERIANAMEQLIPNA